MKQFELVPRVRAVAGAGESLETDDHIDGYYAFRDDFFRKNSIHPKKCAMLLVRGDSMEPLIRDGDFILVDQGGQGSAGRIDLPFGSIRGADGEAAFSSPHRMAPSFRKPELLTYRSTGG